MELIIDGAGLLNFQQNDATHDIYFIQIQIQKLSSNCLLALAFVFLSEQNSINNNNII